MIRDNVFWYSIVGGIARIETSIIIWNPILIHNIVTTFWINTKIFIETNIIIFKVQNAAAHKIIDMLRDKNVLGIALGEDTIRFVTNLDISEQDTDDICKIIQGLSV